MSWTISASGKKADAIAAVQAQTSVGGMTVAGPESKQFQGAKDHILEALDRVPDGSRVLVSASGHADDLVQYESISINSEPAEADDTNV